MKIRRFFEVSLTILITIIETGVPFESPKQGITDKNRETHDDEFLQWSIHIKYCSSNTKKYIKKKVLKNQSKGDNSILLKKSELPLDHFKYEERIPKAGEQKLQTIMQNMAFRRNIMATEWEHKRLRMEINDLTEQINDIEGIKFTREMQTYLKAKSLGRKTDHDSFEQEVDILIMTYENSLKEKKEQYRKIIHQINTYKEHNVALDKAIQEVNIDVCQLSLQKDLQIECKQNEMLRLRMDDFLKRNALVHTIQQNHNEMLVLQTELELLRLRTYPTFKYKLINPEE